MSNIKDVASLAGVSIATVSRVLNNSDKVKEKTRDKVMDAIHQLNFTPNFHAQGLQTKASKTIGLIFPDASSYYFAEIIRGITNIFKQQGYQIIVASSHDEADEVRTLINLLRSGRVDGMVLMLPSVQNVNAFINSLSDTPAVYLSTNIQNENATTVVIDNYDGAYKMTEHLISHGHKRIAFIHGSANNYDSQERYSGFKDAIEAHNIDSSVLFESHGNFTESTGFKCTMGLLNQTVRPSAIFCANDAMAIGAIEAIRQLSLEVPKDVAVVGFDDISTAKYINPSLTTVYVPTYNVGKIVADSLLKQLNNKDENVDNKIIVPLTLTIRKSCGCTGEQ